MCPLKPGYEIEEEMEIYSGSVHELRGEKWAKETFKKIVQAFGCNTMFSVVTAMPENSECYQTALESNT